MAPPAITPDPDAPLVARAREGDEGAITELYHGHSQRAYNLALRMTGDPWTAADVAQEAFIKAFAHISAFKGEARFSTWLHRIVVNAARDHQRRRRPEVMEDEILDRIVSQDGGGTTAFSGGAVAPAEDGLSPEIKQALADLPEGFRLAIVLCDLLGYGYAEAAEILEVQEGTIKSRVFRARAELASALRAAGYAPAGDGNPPRPPAVPTSTTGRPTPTHPPQRQRDA